MPLIVALVIVRGFWQKTDNKKQSAVGQFGRLLPPLILLAELPIPHLRHYLRPLPSRDCLILTLVPLRAIPLNLLQGLGVDLTKLLLQHLQLFLQLYFLNGSMST